MSQIINDEKIVDVSHAKKLMFEALQNKEIKDKIIKEVTNNVMSSGKIISKINEKIVETASKGESSCTINLTVNFHEEFQKKNISDVFYAYASDNNLIKNCIPILIEDVKSKFTNYRTPKVEMFDNDTVLKVSVEWN